MAIITPYRSPIRIGSQPLPGNLSANLLAMYGMGEGGGTKLMDSFGYQSGTYMGSTPKWNGNGFVPSIAMNGTDNYLNCGSGLPYQANIANRSGFSMCCWVYPTSLVNGYNSVAALQSGGNYVWEVFYESSGALSVYCYIGGTVDPASTPYVTANAWHHIALTVGQRNGLLLILNGKVVGTVGYGSVGLINQPTYSLFFGGNNAYPSRWMSGQLGPCAIWQRELGVEEVQDLYRMPELLYLSPTRILSGAVAAAASHYIQSTWEGGFNKQLVGGLYG